MASPDAVSALAAEVDKTFGRCDILINNAGIFKLQLFEEMSFADWRQTLSINLDSAFLMCAAFVPGMKQRGWGRIVNMASSHVLHRRVRLRRTTSPARAASSA